MQDLYGYRFQLFFISPEISLNLIKYFLNLITQYWRFFFINMNIFRHLKLEIASAIPASNDENRNKQLSIARNSIAHINPAGPSTQHNKDNQDFIHCTVYMSLEVRFNRCPARPVYIQFNPCAARPVYIRLNPCPARPVYIRFNPCPARPVCIPFNPCPARHVYIKFNPCPARPVYIYGLTLVLLGPYVYRLTLVLLGTYI